MSDHHDLTRRERQTLWLVCMGMKNGAIAEKMGVKGSTVHLHLRNLYRKTQTADKVDLVRAAWRFCVKQQRQPIKKNEKPTPRDR